MTTLDTALSYADSGWPVFPCNPKNKQPLIEHGFKAASDDPETIKAWWKRHPTAMIGVPTGAPSGVWVLDIDMGEEVNGEAVLADLEAEHGALPATITSLTPSGGRHMLFSLPPDTEIRNRGRFAAGLDVRANGGYIVVPGSVKDDGTFYEWAPTEAEEPANAPDWLLGLVTKKQEPSPTATHASYVSGKNEPYVDAAISGELSTLATAPAGTRNNALNDAAFNIGQFVGAGAISEADARGALEAIARQWSNFAKSKATISSGLTAGANNPRSIPEPDETSAEMSAHGTTIVDRLLSSWDKRVGAVTLVADVPEQAAVEPPRPTMHADPFTPESAGGLLGQISNWITESAIIPVPELSMSAAIGLIGGLFGGKCLGPTKSGINMFMTVLLATAGGKGHAPKAIRALADKIDGQGAVTNGDPTSYAALERMLRKNPSTVIVMDEFGITLQDVNGKNASSPASSIRKFLLAIYDQAGSVFDGKTYASAETKKDDAPLRGPALTVLAMTTPSTLFAGLSESSIVDGFMNRFLFVTTKPLGVVRPPKLDVQRNVPTRLVEALRKAVTVFPKAPGISPTSINKYEIKIEDGEDGEAWARWVEVFMWQHGSDWDDLTKHVIGRAAENTMRLATIRAISSNPENPVICLDDIEWGWSVVHKSIDLILDGVKKHMSDSPAEALRNAIKDAIRKAPDQTLAYAHLLQRKGVSKAETYQLEGALKWLLSTGEIVDLAGKGGGKGSKFKIIEHQNHN